MKQLLTLCLVHQDPYLLLGMKKRGFGVGRWNGFGGKVLPWESVEHTARRELKEEVGISAPEMTRRGILHFKFDNDPRLLEVYVFGANRFRGEPTESEEMKPKWFHVAHIPYDEMWPDDRYWLPLFLRGKQFEGEFFFRGMDQIIRKQVHEVEFPAYPQATSNIE